MAKQASELKPILFVVTSNAVKGVTGTLTRACMAHALLFIEGLPISDAEKALIAHGNAERLLGL